MTDSCKVHRWAQKELEAYLGKIIVHGPDQDLVAFDRFRVRPTQHQCQVWEHNDLRQTFSNCRTAVSWCVAVHHDRFDVAETIVVLDQTLQILDHDCSVRKKLALKSSQPGFRDRVLTKLQTKLDRQTQVKVHLEKCISLTKYLQLRGF